MKLVVAPESEAVDLARQLADRTQPANREKVIEFIETVLVYKFHQMSREEVEAMFTLSDLKQTRVYQDALEEGRQEGRQEGEKRGQVTIILRLLTRKFKRISPSIARKIDKLTSAQLEKLAEAMLDFENIAALEAWLKTC